jgi:hypothetical protein
MVEPMSLPVFSRLFGPAAESTCRKKFNFQAVVKLIEILTDIQFTAVVGK